LFSDRDKNSLALSFRGNIYFRDLRFTGIESKFDIPADYEIEELK